MGDVAYRTKLLLPNSFLILGPTMSGKTTTFSEIFSDPLNFEYQQFGHVNDDTESIDDDALFLDDENDKRFRNVLICGDYADSLENGQLYSKLKNNTLENVILLPLGTLHRTALGQVKQLFLKPEVAFANLPTSQYGLKILSPEALVTQSSKIANILSVEKMNKTGAEGDSNLDNDEIGDLIVLDDCQIPSNACKVNDSKRDQNQDTFQSFLSRDIHHKRKTLVCMQQSTGGSLQQYFYQNTPYVIQQIRNTSPNIVHPIIHHSGILRGLDNSRKRKSFARLQNTLNSIQSSPDLIRRFPFGVWHIRGANLSHPVLTFHDHKLNEKGQMNLNKNLVDYFTF